ncbi:MAG: class I SAM-dependent methyltransferase [Candidatus Dormibacteraceae bacterium]
MEEVAARFYARHRGSGNQAQAYSKQALIFTRGLRRGADVLEVGAGPGYLAIEMARLRRFQVTGLDISRSFVEIANQNARQAAVKIDFRLGDAANMPFDSESFDLVVCQAAFNEKAVTRMELSWPGAFMTKWSLAMVRRRAYSRGSIRTPRCR